MSKTKIPPNIAKLAHLIREDWDSEVFKNFCLLVKMPGPERRKEREDAQ